MKTTNKLLIAIILVIGLTSCGVSKITVAGQYGDYSFIPRITLATRTSGSLVADDTLVLPVVSGVTYRIVVHTLTKNSTATVGMVARLDHSTITATGSEVVGHLTNSGGNATVTPSSSTALTNMVNQNGQNLSTRMEVILTPAASGDVKVMWGARVPAGVETAGLNAGSYLEITQLI